MVNPECFATSRKNVSVYTVGYTPMCVRFLGPYGAKENSFNSPSFSESNCSIKHDAYASSNGAANLVPFVLAFAANPIRPSEQSISFKAFPTASPHALNVASASSSEAYFAVSGSHFTISPTRSFSTWTDTPSCACVVNWSIMWSKNGCPVAICPRLPIFSIDEVDFIELLLLLLPRPIVNGEVTSFSLLFSAFTTVFLLRKSSARR
mmetsp:Transcript_6400/g.21385  ORF Transcript_6400/g.21385 Transcript_6400/m.21385 type:complete len:207 (-) Transcript_6400:163-783(-)